MQDAYITTISLERAYQRGSETVHALHELNLTIAQGEFVVVLGPSGSGKSTLLNLLGGIDRPTRGDLWVDGSELNVLSESQLDRYRRDRVGFVFQFNNLLPSLTAEENVGLPLVAQGSTWKQARAQAASQLAELGLADRLSHLPSELSGGEQQRVALARAIIKAPSIVLADEPTGDLDSDRR